MLVVWGSTSFLDIRRRLSERETETTQEQQSHTWQIKSNVIIIIKGCLTHLDHRLFWSSSVVIIIPIVSTVTSRPQRSIETIASFDQWSGTIKNHWKRWWQHQKTIAKPLMAMVRPPKKHSMVMVSSKTIENLQWSLQNHWNLQWFPKSIELVNGPLKSIFC